jgi:hypothetical protein
MAQANRCWLCHRWIAWGEAVVTRYGYAHASCARPAPKPRLVATVAPATRLNGIWPEGHAPGWRPWR